MTPCLDLGRDKEGEERGEGKELKRREEKREGGEKSWNFEPPLHNPVEATGACHQYFELSA